MAGAALRDALAGNLVPARRQAQAGLALSHGRDVEAASAEALALAGDSGEASRLAGDLAKRFPEDTIVQTEYLPMIQAGTDLGVGHKPDGAAKAIEALAVAVPYELRAEHRLLPAGRGIPGGASRHCGGRRVPEDSGSPGELVNFVTGALAHLGLGRAYALAGDNAKARIAYQDFLALWKDADPDVPVLKQAKAEYARLAKAGAP